MQSRLPGILGIVLLMCCIAVPATAAPPWASLLPFKKVEANPSSSYDLEDKHGPWLILAANFAGPGAEDQAQALVHELRKRYKMPAYMHRKSFDAGPLDDTTKFGRNGIPTRMKYVNQSTANYEAIAVLVGDFDEVDDEALESSLKKIKTMQPNCLSLNEESRQQFAGLRAVYQLVNREKKRKGPMGHAFVTRNPLLPKEFFAPNGVDDFVLRLNRPVRHSLLKCDGNYSVRVASFRGQNTINQREIAELQGRDLVSSKLAEAADKAHRLTLALRKKGVEAFEFHDRHESIVTVGSFASEGKPLADGTVDINPEILKIMKTYGAQRQTLPGGQEVGLRPRSLGGIAFDIQPMPVRVPKRSIAKDYARNLRLR